MHLAQIEGYGDYNRLERKSGWCGCSLPAELSLRDSTPDDDLATDARRLGMMQAHNEDSRLYRATHPLRLFLVDGGIRQYELCYQTSKSRLVRQFEMVEEK